MKDGIAQVLVVVDMQNDFVYERGSLYVHKNDDDNATKDVVGEVCKLIDVGINWDAVVCTLDTHFGNYQKTLEGEKLPVPHCVYGTWGHELHDDVKKALDSTGHYRTVEKNTFGSLDLVDYEIRESLDFEHDVTLPFGTKGGELEIHICGVCTSICVLANAVLIRAKYPDAKIVVHKDACADVTNESHEAALKVLQSQQCEIV